MLLVAERRPARARQGYLQFGWGWVEETLCFDEVLGRMTADFVGRHTAAEVTFTAERGGCLSYGCWMALLPEVRNKNRDWKNERSIATHDNGARSGPTATACFKRFSVREKELTLSIGRLLG